MAATGSSKARRRGRVAIQALMTNFHRPFADLVRLARPQSLQAEIGRLDDVHHYEIDPLFLPGAAQARRSKPANPPSRLQGT